MSGSGGAVAAAALGLVAGAALWRARQRRQFGPFGGALVFVPFETAAGDAVVAVDCAKEGLTSITHHRCSGRKQKAGGLVGDSSTELVLDAIAANHQALRGKRLVTCNHFDIDAFLSVAALALQPATRERQRALLAEAARIGDFRELRYDVLADSDHPESATVDLALKLCCLLNTLERDAFARPFETRDHDKWSFFLADERVRRLVALGDAEASRPVWEPEYTRVVTECRRLRAPSVSQIEHFADIGLVAVATPEPVHYYALFSVVGDCDIVVACYSSGRYEVEQRYSTYVEITSRPVFPRLCMTRLARILRELAPTEHWGANRFVDSGPLLRIDLPGERTLNKAERYGHPFERPIFASRIPQKHFVTAVCSFFRSGLAQQRLKREAGASFSFERLHAINGGMDWSAVGAAVKGSVAAASA